MVEELAPLHSHKSDSRVGDGVVDDNRGGDETRTGQWSP